MALNYTRLADTAERLIEENGRTLTVLKGGEVVANPCKPYGPDATTGDLSYDLIGVIINFENEAFDGTLIMRGDMRCLLAHNSVVAVAGSGSVEIERFDRLLDGTEDWKIENVIKWEPGDTRIFYDLQLRK